MQTADAMQTRTSTDAPLFMFEPRLCGTTPGPSESQGSERGWCEAKTHFQAEMQRLEGLRAWVRCLPSSCLGYVEL